jgi:serine/threonine protein kinase
VATQYDITFFKIAIYNKVTDQATATRCLQYIEQAAGQGRTVSAQEAFQSTGVEQSLVAQLNTLTQGALKQRGTAAGPPATTPPAPGPNLTGSQRVASLSGSQRSATATGSQRRPAGAAAAPISNGQIQFKEKIASGPCGPAYHGLDRSSGRKLILKVLSGKFAKHPQYLQAIMSDINGTINAQLKSENILPTHAVFERDNRLIVVSEPSTGATLATVLKEYGALPPSRAVKLAIQVAKALEVAHKEGISHGDLRPDKVFVTMKTGLLQVADFGFARASALIQGFARLGVPFGHPAYLAPEIVQQQPKEPSPQHDLYALGILLYELVVGQQPFKGSDTQEVLAMHFKAPLPKPPENIYLHRKLAEVLMKLTAKSPDKRIKSASQAVTFLTALTRLDLEASSESAEMDGQQAMTGADWENVSNEAAAHSQEWSEEKIRETSESQSEEWNPDDEEDDPEWEELAKSRKSNRIKRATQSSRSKTINNDLQNLAEAIATTDVNTDGRVKESVRDSERAAVAKLNTMGKKNAPGNRFSLDGNQLRERQQKMQKVWGFLIGVSLALFAVVAVIIGIASAPEPKREITSSGTKNGKGAEPVEAPKIPKKAGPVPAEIIQLLEKGRQEALDKVNKEVDAKRGIRDWSGALSVIRGFPSHLKKDKVVSSELQELEEKIIRLAKGELDRAKNKIRSYLRNNEPRPANGELAKVKGRLISETYPAFQLLEKEIRTVVKRLAAAPKLVDKARLKKWQRHLPDLLFGDFAFKKDDTVLIQYNFTKKQQKRDFNSPPKKVAIGSKKDPGFYINTGKGGSLLLPFAIPIKDMQSCEFEYEITEAQSLGKTSEVALFLGLDRFTRSKGLRLNNMGQVLEFRYNRNSVKFKTRKKNSVFKPWRDKGNHFKIIRNGELIVVTINKTRLLRFSLEEIDGYFGFFVQNLKVRITNFKFAATFDPSDVNAYAKGLLNRKSRKKKPVKKNK